MTIHFVEIHLNAKPGASESKHKGASISADCKGPFITA